MLKHLFYSELLLLWRRAHDWIYPLGFFVIVISLFPLAFSPDPNLLEKIIPGGIWIAALLASLLSIAPVFNTDLEDGALEQLLLSRVQLTFILLVKFSAQWLFTQLPLILLTPVLAVLFQLSPFATFSLCLSLLIGTPILILVGGFCVALTLGLRQQGALLGLLMLPLVIPVLIFGVSITQQAQAGFSIIAPVSFLAGLSVFAITVLPITIAATLRIGME